jgi:hypothetical protein
MNARLTPPPFPKPDENKIRGAVDGIVWYFSGREHRKPVVVFDLVGRLHGLPPPSPSICAASWAIFQMVKDGRLDSEKLEKFSIGGLSIGGWGVDVQVKPSRTFNGPEPAVTTHVTAGEKPASKRALALAVLQQHPEWSDTRIAKAAGCSRTTLYRWPFYVKARELLASGKKVRPRGSKSKDGVIEAWSNDEGE